MDDKPVSRGRHEFQCSICKHEQREEIERAFINWISPGQISKKYHVSRDAVYRHAHALKLMEPRRRNVRAALEKIIERAGEVEVNAAAVVSAISAYARINARGDWVERTNAVNMNELFNRMTADELDTYAKTGTPPSWFTATLGATPSSSQEDGDGN